MLEVSNLTRRFGDHVAVNDVSFVVPEGSFTGFVGGNGAGKTTTMRMIMGLLAPHGGSVTWQGQPITTKDRAAFGYMPEERGLYPKQPILSQLTYFGELYGMNAGDAKQEASSLLERFGLGDRMKDKLESLSLGNQQRVQIAAAVMADPICLVLDEPFSGLDPDAVDEMFVILSELTKRGVPVLFSSHQLDLVERLCEHMVILAKGQVMVSGTVDSIRESAGHDHRIVVDGDLGWLRDEAGVEVIDIDGGRAQVRFADPSAEQRVLASAISRGPVREFGPNRRPLSEIYREVTR
ncbi:ABC transporter ATP-binding protein [Parenemella sanctibonifatiensis]|uniref:ABC transporter ATP-binding protein n=1 Tax=Parenemella sanctibonifatiensis TaxID=2016505 RepID=A0A255EF95_9ACTN|nr:ATP-binding cassette domain-containing protein [Parenemella sanctibonifatiensis]OYN90208.1 ABC transporter ATP-binding protein [Parenemella sanctibonifatiensis]